MSRSPGTASGAPLEPDLQGEAFRRIFDESPVGMHLIDRDFRILRANRAFCELLGHADPSELEGVALADILHPDDMAVGLRLARRMRNGEIPGYTLARRYLHRDGHPIETRFKGTFVTDEHGEVRFGIGVVEDLTPLRRSDEERLRLALALEQNQKNEALSVMAAGMAHDFNNVLNAIIGYATLTDGLPGEEPLRHRYQQKILAAAQQATELVQRMLAFAQPGDRHPVRTQLVPIINDCTTMVAAADLPALSVETHLAADAREVMADRGHLQQILLNLLTNASQAMPNGGRIWISSCLQTITDPTAFGGAVLEPGRYCRLALTDNGPGIAEQDRERLFDPFFSSRREAGGTGLGLAITRTLVNSHGGGIDLGDPPSGSGQTGASFVLLLPAPPALPEATDLERPGSDQAVLVVNEDRSAAAMDCEMLRMLGYRPTWLSSARQTLHRLQETPGEFQVLLVSEDLAIMDGPALALAAHTLAPTLPVVLLTRRSRGAEPQAQATDKDPASNIAARLTRPLRPSELTTVLRRVLGDAPAPAAGQLLP